MAQLVGLLLTELLAVPAIELDELEPVLEALQLLLGALLVPVAAAAELATAAAAAAATAWCWYMDLMSEFEGQEPSRGAELAASTLCNCFSCFLYLARLFWNQTWMRASLSLVALASSSRQYMSG